MIPQNREVIELMAAIFQRADSTILPILADQIEINGCEDQELLGLLRNFKNPWEDLCYTEKDIDEYRDNISNLESDNRDLRGEIENLEDRLRSATDALDDIKSRVKGF